MPVGTGSGKEEGMLVAEVEINQCTPSIRYVLTKGATHAEVSFK